MTRKLNIKFFLLLLVGSVLGVVGVVVLHNYQIKRTANYLLIQADRDEKNGDLDKAANALELYIGFRPKDNDALAHYGELLDKKATTPRHKYNAALILESVAKNDPNRVAQLRRAAELFTEVGQYRLANPYWIRLLKDHPEDGSIEGKLALGEVALKRFPEADKLFASAIRHSPKDIDLYVQYAAMLLYRMNQADRAAATLDLLVDANPDQARAYIERGRFRINTKRAGFENDIAKARTLQPDNVDVALLSSQSSIRAGTPEKAASELVLAITRNPKTLALYVTLGAAQKSQGKATDAIETYRKGLVALPESNELRYLLAETLIELGKTTEAEPLVAELDTRLKNAANVRYLSAYLEVAKKRWSEAVTKFEAVLPELSGLTELERKANSFLGLCLDQLAAPERALVAYRRASTLAPEWVVGHLRVASTLTTLNRLEEALREYRNLPITTPGVVGSIVRLRLAQNRKLPEAQRRWDDVDALLLTSEKMHPGSLESLSLKIDVMLARGNLGESRTLIEKARADYPNQIAPSLALMALFQAERKSTEAFKVLTETEQKFGDVPDVRLAKIRYWIATGGSEAVKQLAAIRADLSKFTEAEQSVLLENLALANLRLGNRDESNQLLEASIKHSPEDLRLRVRQLTYALDSGDDKAITEAVQQLRRIEGETGLYWRIGEASRLIRLAQTEKSTQGLKEARSFLTDVLQRQAENGEVHRLLGIVEDMERKFDQALVHYQQALRGGVQQPTMLGRMARLLVERGRFADANQVYKLLEGMGQKILDDKKGVAEVAVRGNDPERAYTLVRSAVDPNSKEGADFLWQASMYLSLAKTADAETSIQKAIALLPNSAAARLTLVQILLQSGNKEKAKAEAAEAERLFPKENRLELAQIAMLIENRELAAKRFDEGLTSHPDDLALLQEAARFFLLINQPAKSSELYRKLLDPSLAAPTLVRAEARRGVTQALLTSRRAKDLKDAEALIDQNLVEDSKSSLDLKLRALILISQPSRRKDAVRAFEKLREVRPLTVDEGLIVAQVLDADGQWASARQQALTLMGTAVPPFRPTVWYISRLLKQNELEEANLWLSRLEAADPKPIDLSILKARWLNAKNRGAEAVPLLEAKLKEVPEAAPVVIRLFDEIHQSEAAIRVARSFAKTSKNPSATLLLAEILARGGHLSEAIDLCDAAWATCEPYQVAMTSYAICDSSHGRSDRGARDRMAKGIETAIEKNPKLLPLYNTLAQIYLMDLRFSDAEALYAKALTVSPDDAGILNNNAWVYAFVRGRESEGLAKIQKAIELAGSDSHLLDTRGLVQLALGKPQAAIEDFEKSIQGSPGDVATVYFHLALAQMADKQVPAARTSLKRSEDLGLKPELLHPLELPSFDKLRAALTNKK